MNKKKKRKPTKSQVLRFARKIVPRNWNVFLDLKDYKKDSLILNIHLFLFGDAVKSFYDERMQNKKALGSVQDINYRKGIGSYTTLAIFEPVDWKNTLIHELAHIAVMRWIFFKERGYKSEMVFINSRIYSSIESEVKDIHHLIGYKEKFIKAFETIFKRYLLQKRSINAS